MTANALKVWFSEPLSLLCLMLLSSMLSAAKQLVVARRQGNLITTVQYFCKIETLIMLGTNFTFWLGMLFTDTLNAVSVIAGGYVANDTADVWTKSGRSSSIADTLNSKSNP